MNNTNEIIEKLYQKLDAQDAIIDQQALEISQLKEQKKQAIEFLHKNTMIGHCKEHYELLELLGDKE